MRADDFTPDEITKFWQRVDRSNGPDACWPWIGHCGPRGYGVLTRTGQRSVRAHRMAHAIAAGEFPDELVVCHSCDNPSCVNPAHLAAATQAENVRDRDRKGRHGSGPNAPGWVKPPLKGHRRGEGAARSKLTADQIREIRQRYACGDGGYHKLAVEYGVHDYSIEMIVKRRSWKHIE